MLNRIKTKEYYLQENIRAPGPIHLLTFCKVRAPTTWYCVDTIGRSYMSIYLNMKRARVDRSDRKKNNRETVDCVILSWTELYLFCQFQKIELASFD